jgi:hypothetical protein
MSSSDDSHDGEGGDGDTPPALLTLAQAKKLKVAQLREAIEDHGLPSDGTKDTLIARLSNKLGGEHHGGGGIDIDIDNDIGAGAGASDSDDGGGGGSGAPAATATTVAASTLTSTTTSAQATNHAGPFVYRAGETNISRPPELGGLPFTFVDLAFGSAGFPAGQVEKPAPIRVRYNENGRDISVLQASESGAAEAAVPLAMGKPHITDATNNGFTTSAGQSELYRASGMLQDDNDRPTSLVPLYAPRAYFIDLPAYKKYSITMDNVWAGGATEFTCASGHTVSANVPGIDNVTKGAPCSAWYPSSRASVTPQRKTMTYTQATDHHSALLWELPNASTTTRPEFINLALQPRDLEFDLAFGHVLFGGDQLVPILLFDAFMGEKVCGQDNVDIRAVEYLCALEASYPLRFQAVQHVGSHCLGLQAAVKDPQQTYKCITGKAWEPRDTALPAQPAAAAAPTGAAASGQTAALQAEIDQLRAQLQRQTAGTSTASTPPPLPPPMTQDGINAIVHQAKDPSELVSDIVGRLFSFNPNTDNDLTRVFGGCRAGTPNRELASALNRRYSDKLNRITSKAPEGTDKSKIKQSLVEKLTKDMLQFAISTREKQALPKPAAQRVPKHGIGLSKADVSTSVVHLAAGFPVEALAAYKCENILKQPVFEEDGVTTTREMKQCVTDKVIADIVDSKVIDPSTGKPYDRHNAAELVTGADILNDTDSCIYPPNGGPAPEGRAAIQIYTAPGMAVELVDFNPSNAKQARPRSRDRGSGRPSSRRSDSGSRSASSRSTSSREDEVAPVQFALCKALRDLYLGSSSSKAGQIAQLRESLLALVKQYEAEGKMDDMASVQRLRLTLKQSGVLIAGFDYEPNGRRSERAMQLALSAQGVRNRRAEQAAAHAAEREQSPTKRLRVDGGGASAGGGGSSSSDSAGLLAKTLSF